MKLHPVELERLTPEMTMTYKEAVEKVLESHKVKAENLENYNLYSLVITNFG